MSEKTKAAVRKGVCRIGAFLLLLCLMTASVSAETQVYVPLNSYEYNSRDASVEAPAGYAVSGHITGEALGVGALCEPQDLCFTQTGELWILDSGNGRILVLDGQQKLRRQLRQLTWRGEAVDFTGAKGLFVSRDGTLYLADTAHQRVLIARPDGTVTAVIEKPDTDLIEEQTAFNVTKVMHDENGITYVLVDGITDGALSFDSDGSFIGFYGTNRIKLTAAVLSEYIWSKFMTRTQISSGMRRTPASFTNFDIDDDQFIYTVTGTTNTKGNFRKLNFKGLDLLEVKQYGDEEVDPVSPEKNATSFVDVEVDSQGFISALDQTMGRVFQYSPDGELITLFGGMGDRLGELSNPVALESSGSTLYVLDSQQNAVILYTPTAYTLAKRRAIQLFNDGEYEASVEYWNTVLQMNSNSEMAYAGIGKACEENEQFEKAMEYYRLANDREGYSTAYREVRKTVLKQWFPLIFALVIIGIALLIFVLQRRRKKALSGYEWVLTPARCPFHMLLHPVDCCEERLKRRKMGSYRAVLCILLALFLALNLEWFLTGFLFNTRQAQDYKILIVLVQAGGIYLVWCLANWAVCTLIEGKGSWKEILCMTAYALIPLIAALYVRMLLTNVLTLNESGFITLVLWIGILWSGSLLLAGLAAIHQFSFGKTIASVLLTLLAIAIILFLLTLFYGLIQQLISFVSLIYSEIRMMQ